MPVTAWKKEKSLWYLGEYIRLLLNLISHSKLCHHMSGYHSMYSYYSWYSRFVTLWSLFKILPCETIFNPLQRKGNSVALRVSLLEWNISTEPSIKIGLLTCQKHSQTTHDLNVLEDSLNDWCILSPFLHNYTNLIDFTKVHRKWVERILTFLGACIVGNFNGINYWKTYKFQCQWQPKLFYWRFRVHSIYPLILFQCHFIWNCDFHESSSDGKWQKGFCWCWINTNAIFAFQIKQTYLKIPEIFHFTM